MNEMYEIIRRFEIFDERNVYVEKICDSRKLGILSI